MVKQFYENYFRYCVPITFINDLVICNYNFWQLVTNDMTQGAINDFLGS